MKKCKGIAEIAVLEVGQVGGVRTRARTLAALRRRSDEVSGELQKSYLELRSRRLLKNAAPKKPKRRESKPEAETCLANSGPKPTGEDDLVGSRCSSVASRGDDAGVVSDLEVERSLAEKNHDYNCTESCPVFSFSVREEDLRKESETPGSSTSKACDKSHDSSHNPSCYDSGDCSRNPPIQTTGTAPPASEIEAFFAAFDNEEQRRFTKKYNYDVVKDIPLDGRYDWVKVTP